MNFQAGSKPSCHYLPPNLPFLAHLAGWLLENYGKNPEEFSRLLILLPNRRSCRSLREALLAKTDGKPLLLPQIQPIGDVDEQVLWMDQYVSELELESPIAPLKREMLLTHMLLEQTEPSNKRPPGFSFSLEQASALAGDLAFLLDEIAYEGASFSNLENLAPEDYSEHWQQTVQFLSVISHSWPKRLAQENAIDAAQYRMRMLQSIAKLWQQTPPARIVIAAGIHSTLPPVVDLLKVIAHMPQGYVILPGLDVELPDSQWEQLTPTHPQFSLKWMLERMDIKRRHVQLLAGEGGRGTTSRSICLRHVFDIAPATAHWAQADLPLAEGMKHCHVLELPTQQEEAKAIAALLRETLETPEKTAALITPDRQLARMVIAQLKRLQVNVDDSGGAPLSRQKEASFLQLVCELAQNRIAPATLLALLRHPTAAAGKSPVTCSNLAAEIEVKLLRGLRLPSGMKPLLAKARKLAKREKNALSADALQLLEDMAKQGEKFFALMQSANHQSLEEVMRAHLSFAQWLASSAEMDGPRRLWHGEAAQQLSSILAEILSHASLMPAIQPSSYAAFLGTMLSRHMFRPRYGGHPRLHILGPMEAQLQQYDRVVMGSLSEGQWPATASADPWMSRPMRAAFGLPEHERQIGRSAHDVLMFAHAPEVFFTRAQKVAGSPALPSRWLVRLHTLLQRDEKSASAVYDKHIIEPALAFMNAPDEKVAPITCPEPVVARDVRPDRFSVSAVDRWVDDPYAFYARYILRLKALDELEQEPGPREFGNLVHAALEAYIKSGAKPEQMQQLMLEIGKRVFEEMDDYPAVRALWWPRYEGMISWLSEQEERIRADHPLQAAEIEGRYRFEVEGREYTLTGRIDRLACDTQKHACVVDYKTGGVPSKKNIKDGLKNQMPLLGLILNEGELERQKDTWETGHSTQALEYWKVSGSAQKCELQTVDLELIDKAKERFLARVRQFANPQEPYKAAAYSLDKYNDYEQLTRREEWGDV